MKQFSTTTQIGKNIIQLILVVLVLFSVRQASAQAITSYSFAQSSGTYKQAGLGASLTSSGCWDDQGFSSISLPFSFNYAGSTFTTVVPGPNGYAHLGGSANEYLGYSAMCDGYSYLLSAMNTDLYGCVSNGADFSYVTTGASPNRVFTMQWSSWGFYSSALNEFSFQIKLYETSNKVQFVYQNGTATSSGSVYVGLTGASNSDFQGRTTTSNWAATTAAGSACSSTCTINSSVRPANGLTFTWTSASTVAAMAFTQTTSTYVPVVGGSASTSFTGSGCYDDQGFASASIPFTFNYHGTNYTTFVMGPNGYIHLNGSGFEYLGYSVICGGTSDVLSPLNADLYGCTANGGDASYTTLGTSPNRTFVIQWSNWGFYSSGLNEFSFQVRLQETTNTVTFMYGPSPGTSGNTVYVGLTGATGSDFQGRTTTSNWSSTTAAGSACGSTCSITSGIRPTNGLTFTWSPPSCSNPTVSVSPTSSTICAGQSVALTASCSANCGGINYTWSPAAGLNTTVGTNVTASPAATTTYTVTGTVTGGCASTATSVVTVGAAPSPVATATPPTVCAGGSSQLNAASSAPQTYHIALGNLVNVPNNCGGGSMYSDCGAGSPGFTWTDIGAGAVSSLQIKVQIGVDCNGSGVAHTLTLNGQNIGSFTPNGNFCSCGFQNYLVTINPGTAGYNVGGSNTLLMSSGNTCFGFISASGTTLYPDYAQVIVNYGGTATSWSWSPTTFLNNPTLQNPVASGVTATTTYTVTASSAAGCSATSSVTLTAGASLVVAPTAVPPAVSGGVNGYSFTQAVSPAELVSIENAGTLLGSGFQDDENWSTVTMPFTFSYHGNSFTTVGISDNGYIVLGGITSTNYLPLNGLANCISAMGADMLGNAGGHRLEYATTGSGANQVFRIQWSHWGKYNVTADEATFQIAFFKTSNVVEIGYIAAPGSTSFSCQAGLTGTTVSDFIDRTTTTNWSATTAGGSNTAQLSFSSTVKPVSGLTYIFSPPSGPPCPGGTWTLNANASGGGTPYTYSWAGAGLVTNNAATVTAIPSSTTTYTVTVSDNCGSTTTQTVTATVQSVSVSVSPTSSTLCGGQSVTLTASGTGSFGWSPSAGLNTNTGTTVIASPSVTTTYTVTATSGICTATATSLVTVNAAPSVTASAAPPSVCSGGTSQLTATTTATQVYHVGLGGIVNGFSNCGNGYYTCGGTVGFTWTDIGAGSVSNIDIQWGQGVECSGVGYSHTTTLNGTAAPNFTTTVSNCYCTPVAPVMMGINWAGAGYAVGGTNTFLVTALPTCYGFQNATNGGAGDYATITVTYGSSGNTFSWSPATFLNNPTNQNPVASGITSTTTYTVTASNGGCSATSSTTVTAGTTLVAAPTAIPPTVSSGSYCIPVYTYGCGFPDVITNVTYAGINNTTGTTCGQGGNLGYDPLFTAPNPTITAGAANTLSVTTGGDVEGMAAWIDYNQDGTFSASEMILNGYYGTNPATYTASVNIPTSAYNGLTRLRVRCTYNSNPTGLSDPPCGSTVYGETEDYNITIAGATTFSTVPCPGGTWTLHANESGGGVPYTFAWAGAGLVTNNTSTVTAIPSATTTYTVTVTDNCGQSVIQTVTATIQDVNIAVTPTSTSQCDYQSIALTASGNMSTFSWAPSSGLNNTTGASVTANPLLTTTYTVTGTLGACTVSATSLVTVNLSPIVDATATPTSVCEGGTSQLDANGHYLNYVSWSDNFTAGSVTTGAQCTKWNNFAASLAPQNYLKMTLRGSNDPTGVYVDDPTIVQQIAAAMYGGYDGTWTSNGRQWHVSHCSGLELGGDESACICYNPGYEIRPCIANANWGGMNSYTCSAFGSVPSQTMEVEFQISVPATGATYSWTPTTFLNNPSSATPVASGITSTTTYTVTANNAGCSSTLSTSSVTVSEGEPLVVTASAQPPAPVGYCTPGQSPNSCFYMFITQVTIAGTALNNPSGCATSSFVLYPATGNTTAALTAGNTFTITLASIANPMNFSAWIDADHDGVYSASEMVINNFPTQFAANTTFTVPSSLTNGQTRMRIRADYQFSAPVSDPCATLTYGETEDYIVTLSGGTTVPACPNFPWELSSTVTGGGEPYSYLWTGPGLVTNNTANVTAIPSATTTYTVTVTDNCGTTSTQTVTTDVQDVTASIDISSITQCDNQSVVLTASGIATSFTWAPAAGLNTTAGASVTANPQVTTTYTVTAHSGLCTATATSMITVNAAPAIAVTATPSNICNGGTSQLDAGTSGGSQLYHIGFANLTGMPSYCGGGSYYNNCSSNIGFTWTDIGSGSVASMQIQLGIGVDCNGSGVSHTVTLNGQTIGSFTPSGNWCSCGFINNVVTINPSTTGYAVGGFNSISITSGGTCFGMINNTSLGADYAQVTVTYGGSGTTISWSPSTFLNDPSSPTPVASNVTATTTYTLTATNATCTSTGSVTVHVDPLVPTPTATVSGPSAYCNPTMYSAFNNCSWIDNLTTSGGATNISPAVDAGFNNGGLSYFTSPSVSQNAGSPFTLSVQAQGGCINYSYFSVWVDWNQNGVFDGSEKMVNNVNCNNNLTNFTINIPATAINGTTRMRVIDWASGAPPGPCDNLSGYYGETEDYNVTVLNGVIPGPPCAGSASFQLHAGVTGGGSPYTYDWQPTTNLDNGSIENPVATPQVTTTYTVTVSDICGNVESGSVTVTVTPLPTVTVSPTSSDVCPGYAPITLTASGADTYSWSPATGLNSATGASVQANPATSATYVVTGITNGCSNTATTAINVSPVVTVSATATPSIICPGASSTLDAIGSAGGGGTTYIVSSIAYAPVSGSQSFVSLGDDQVSGALSIGFAFPFFGNTYTQFYISSNGFITFNAGSGNGCCQGQFIPNPSDPNNLIALDWEDFYPPLGGTIGYFSTGTQLVVQWTGIGHYSTGSYPMSGQIVLNADGSIQMHATSISVDFDGVGETMGIENSDGTQAYDVEGWNQTDDWTASNESWSFTPFSTNLTYAWEPSSYLDDATSQSPVASGMASSTEFTVTATSNVGCTASNTVTVEIADTTFGGLSEDYCDGDGAILLVPVTPGGTFSGTGVVQFQGDYYFDPAASGIGTFYISYGLPYGCGSTQVTTVHPLPEVTLAPFDPVCSNTPPYILTGGSPAGGIYFDQFGYVTGGNTFDPGAAGAGTHTIYYQYFDQYGCSAFQSADITVSDPTITVYTDNDNDGVGAGDPMLVCVQPAGTSLFCCDCNDNDASVTEPQQYYVDADEDGFGSTLTAMVCSSVATAGYSTNNTDCNDNDASVNTPQLYYVDGDQDGYGSTATAMLCSSTAPTGYSTVNTDCNDGNAAVNPGATDICDGIDDNCDGTIDENPLVATVTPSGTVTECRTVPVTLSANTGALITYQWYKGATLQPGATNSTFTTTKRGSFKVVESTGTCNSTSAYTTVARLAIPQASITVYSTLDLCSAGSVLMRANAAGAHGIGYQWNKGGIPIVGATDRPFTATSTGDYTVTVYGNTGCNVTSSIVTVYSSCKGSEPVLFSSELNLYPNPNRGDFMVELNFSDDVNSEADVQVINMLSQTIYMNRTAVVNGKLVDEVKFDGSVAAGNYLVRVIVGDKVYTGQITYQK